MIREYTCPSCGSNLSLVHGRNIFECSYCGELYSDEIRKIDIALIEEMKDKELIGKARNYTEYLLEKKPDNWKLQWENLTFRIYPNLPSSYIRSHSILPLGFDFHGFKLLIPDDLQHYVDDLHQLDYIYTSIREIGRAADGDYQTYDRATARVRWLSYNQRSRDSQNKQNNDIIFGIAWFFIFFFSLMFRSVPITVLAIVVPLLFYIFVIIWNTREEKRPTDLRKMKDIVEGYEQNKKEKDEELKRLRSEARELLSSLKKDEEEIRKLLV